MGTASHSCECANIAMKNSNVKNNKWGMERSILSAALVLLMALMATITFAFEEKGSCADKYSFVNKRFACFEKHVINKKDYRDLRGRLIDYIKAEKEAGRAEVVSIFFRDLEAGPTMGISERVDFAPASLLKLPIVLTIMQLVEEGEVNLLEKKHSYQENALSDSEIKKAGYEILPGTAYSLEELITRSLVHSDNYANRLLLEYINSIDGGRKLLSKIYRDLGILEVEDTVSSAVNTKGYSTIFRMLYNSSFLHPDSSESLLNIMARSGAIGGLRNGVPAEIKLSHKYGERIIDKDNNQLHDCGIIYYPGNPYLLCVMTQGENLEELQEIITEISHQVYEEFNSRKL
jgi:beta-lactamase class A